MDNLTNNIQKTTRDGKTAVLYSPGFGAGWYSSNTDYPQLVFDAQIVALVEQGRTDDITEEFLIDLFKSSYGIDLYEQELYLVGNVSQLQIEWVKTGTPFYIEDYDGSESVRTLENFIIA